MTMLRAVVIDNGLHYLEHSFRSNDAVAYRFERIGAEFDPVFDGADILIVPNGSDHIAMLRVREKVARFLDAGHALMCFDGWFTNWVPGNRWIMDNSRPTRDVRYAVVTDRHGVMDGVEIDTLIFSHGISGWWACGYIEPNPAAHVLLADTWGRAIAVIDEVSTPGTIILTASGPLGDGSYDGEAGGPGLLYHNLIGYIARRGAHHERNRATL
ncbi:MAG: hypothetical protein JWQ98_2158 [Chlorobi bacterium]|nr:hypothetical protein [Chlorobiota bacterium]